MKSLFAARIPVVFLAFALLCSMVYIPAGTRASAAQSTFYVDAANGNDATGDGSSGNPWQTIGKAAAVAQAGDTVKIRSGTYRETVTPANSGSQDMPIAYEADTGADVTISGADLVSSPWSVHSGNIYKTTATLGMGDWKNQVFVDGVSMQLARWPNAGADLLTPSTANTDAGTDDSKIIDSDLTQPDGYWNGAGVVVTDKYAWTLASTTVTSYTTGRLNLGSISTFGLAANSPYYLIGKLAALDTGKEWFYDSGTSTLYLQTPTGDNPANHVVEVKARNLAFDLSGKNYIHIKGVKLFASSLNTGSSHDIDIDGIDVKYPSHYEIDAPGVDSSEQHYGIQLGGTHNILHNSTLAYSPGNLVTVTGQDNQVVNNLMHDVAYGPVYGTSQAHIEADGREFLISNNTLYNSGRSVISGRPVNSRIQYNNAYNAMTLTDDGGFMYFSNMDGEGTEIHHNILRGANSSGIDGGIYLDFACFDFKVFDNVISDVTGFGVFFHSYTLFTQAYNNTFYNKSFFRMKNDGGATDAYGTRIINNITYDDLWTAPGFGVVERSNFKAGDPQFVDPANGNLNLKPTSTAIDAGEAVQGITDGYAGSAPDIGAYESGVPQWTAGHNFENPPHPTFTTTNLRYQQLLKNGFFERDVDSTKDWTKTGSQSSTIVQSGGTATVSRYIFTRALQLGSGEDGIEQTVTGLQPNTEYELRGFAKAAVSGQKIRIGVKGYGGNDTFKEITDATWTKGKIRFTTGPSDTSATIYVTKTTTGGYAYVDDVTLMEVDPNAPEEVDYNYQDDDSAPGVTAVNDRDIGTGNNQFEYVGNWLQGPNINAYKGDASFSNTAGDYYQVRFEGTQIKLYSEKQSVAGIVAVSIDGGPETLLDLYSDVDEPQALVYTSPELELGQHILKVRITGDQNAAAGGTWNVADKVEVIYPPVKVINDRDIGTGNNQYEYVGTWLQGPNINAYKGDASFSNTPGDYYQIRFEGTQIKLYSEKQSVAGVVAVSIDGGPETLLDLYSAEDLPQSLVYTSPELEYGPHILKVRITGDKNAAAGGTWNVADKAIVTVPSTKVVNDRDIGPGLYQYNYTGSWLQGPNINAYKGDASFSNTAGDFYLIRFKGTQIKLYSEKGPVMGIVGVSIDGGAETMVDLYSADDVSQILAYTSPELSDGEHVLKVRVTGNQNAAASGTWHVADKVEITLGSGTDSGPGTNLELVDRFVENFESTAAGALPKGWSQLTSHPVGVTIDGNGNHSLTLVEPGNDGVGTGASASFAPIQNRARINLRVMAEQTAHTNQFLTLLDSHGAKVLELLFDYDYTHSGSHIIARRTPDGNWSNLLDYNAKQWYDVQVDVDLIAGTYGIKIDGSDVAADVPLLSAASDITAYSTSTYGWDPGTFHVDDIHIKGPADTNPVPSIVTLVSENFENTAAGSLPKGWTQSTIHPVGVTVDGEGNHSLTLVEPGDDGVGRGASLAFDPIHDTAIVKMRVMAEQTAHTINFLTLLDSKGAKVAELLYDYDYTHSGSHIIARRTPDGNWSNLIEYNANQWYNVQVNVDLHAGTYAIKIDDADVAADIPLLNAATDIAQYAVSTYGWDPGTFHVDDLQIDGPGTAPAKVAVTGITVAGQNGVAAITEPGATLQMVATVAPDNATDKSVNWTVLGENGEATSAATIDKNGLLTAAADGKVKVVATAKDGSGVQGSSAVTIDVTPPVIATPAKLTFLQTEPVAVAFSATDAISGVKSISVTFNGQTSAGPITLDPLALSVGSYPITVTATDNFGHQSTAQFNLVITMDIDHLDELIALGFDKGLIDNGGTENSLIAHVNQIQRDAGDNQKLQNSINATENEVNAQKGKHIDAHYADLLLEDLTAILNADIPTADTVAPSAPTALAAASVTESTVSLTWTASTDNVGVAGYKVYRDGSEVGTSYTASFADSGLTASTTYTYTVKAYDAAGNLSAASNSVQATTSAVSSPAAYSENFESTAIGQMPEGWTTNTPGGSASVQQVADGTNSTNHALTLTQTSYGAADVSATKSITPVTGTVTVDTYMMADQTTSLLSGPNLLDSSGKTILQIAFQQNGKIGYVSSAIAWTDTTMAYSPGKWYDVHVVIDLAADTFDLSIDGTSVLTHESLMAPADNVSQIVFATNMWYPGTVHYDGIQVSSK